MRVLGIDPGLRATGWGVIDVTAGRLLHVANGVCKPDHTLPDAQRLGRIADDLATIIATHEPTCAAIEEIFVAKSAKSALKLGMARGVAMMQCGAAGLEVDEIAARQVKKAVVGTGSADKAQVAAMITRLLGITAVNDDAADALAIAIAAGHGDGLATQSGGRGGARSGRIPAAASGGLGSAIEAALVRDAAAAKLSGDGSPEGDQG